MKSKSTLIYWEDIRAINQRLGKRIRLARIRRKLRQQDMAIRTGLSRSTIQAIERGDPTCAAASVFLVLWNMGLSAEIELLADPGLDDTGLALSLVGGKKRVYVPTKVDNDF